MGNAEERCRVDRAVVCEESLIWFEGVPVVVCDERMAVGLFCYRKTFHCKKSVVHYKNVKSRYYNDDIIMIRKSMTKGMIL